DPRVAGDSHTGRLAAYSLSKQSNLAGYRAGLFAGDPALVQPIVLMRRHLGLILPGPVQAAMVTALGDDAHVAAQRETYRRRRDTLLPALLAAGYAVDHSEAGLYLRSEEHTSELQSRENLVCRLLLENKKLT